MTAAVFSGDYTDLRFIKGRKVAVVSVEIPIEQAAAFVAAFGTPNPATGVPVAIARLDPEKAASVLTPPVPEPIKDRRKFNTLPASQQAAMRCNEIAFQKFMEKRSGSQMPTPVLVRDYCAVESRAEIKHGTPEGDRWLKLNDAYLAWLQVDA